MGFLLRRFFLLSPVATCLISLGSNLGDRAGYLTQALQVLSALPRIQLQRVSQWHGTNPVGGPENQAAFLNGAASLETDYTPRELLHVLQQVEQQVGRQREKQRWAARTIDLDLLLYDQLILHESELTLPHPRMAYRKFVLAPAREVGSEFVHPLTGWTLAQLFEYLESTPAYVALSGGTPDQRRVLVRDGGQQARYASNPVSDGEYKTWEELGSGRAIQNFGQAIEFVQRQHETLQRCVRALAAREVCLSDFWLGDWKPSDSFRQEAGASWQEVIEQTVLPKVLVRLEPLATIREPIPVPTLTVNPEAPDWAATELRAVIDAVREW